MSHPSAGRICKLVKQSYEDPRVVAEYRQVGLWPAEKTLIERFVPPGGRLLDLGCGAGRTSIPLAQMGFQVLGGDISKAMVDAARMQARRARVQVDFEEMDALQLDLLPATFDAILFLYNGLELMPGRIGKAQVLQAVHRLLKPGGVFIFSAHSLYAFNIYALFRLLSLGKMALGRLARLPFIERELGERFAPEQEAPYLQILPPGSWFKLLQQQGFERVYFNTRSRLEQGRDWGIGGHWEDGERFFVGRQSSAG
ncbi:MAG: methyltransferase domain-containing protein [Candidatus Latescibacteria bacterium]|nr:methyltransferase domain-containing protein [Candidatus Latescibacterota bacterium]